METPVTLLGPIGEVRLEPRMLRADCRLLLALHSMLPLLRRHGVSRIRHWGGHIYKRTPTGHISQHAYGLAIDIYEVVSWKGSKRVKLDFARGIGCGGDDPPILNRLACEIERQGMFSEVLTPDWDEAHENHFHLALPGGGRDAGAETPD